MSYCAIPRLVAAVLALLAVAACPATATAAEATPLVEGKDYQRLTVTPEASARINVEEFFCYCCPHCYHADPAIEAWKAKKAADVEFTRVANSLGRADGAALAEAFYIGQSLGVSEKLHTSLFRAVHEEHLDATDLGALQALFARVAGVSKADYDQAADGLAVRLALQRSTDLARRYRVISVPTVVVGGRYATSPVMAGSEERFIDVLSALVEKVRAERP